MFGRNLGKSICWGGWFFVCPLLSAQQTQPADIPVHLQVDAGTPLRLYITNRAWFRIGESVQAKFAEPVWAFDRIVIPAGTTVQGEVVELQPVPGMVRAMAVINGDFTPLKHAQLSFSSLVLPNGQSLHFDARPSVGLNTIYVPPQPAKNKKQNSKKAKNPPPDPNSKAAQLRALIKQQAQTQANGATGGLLDFVRGPNKREWLENFALGKLPYHPQWYRAGTRFDAVLEKPLDFGEVNFSANALEIIGTQPPPDTPANVRLLSTVTSADAKIGDPIMGMLTAPLFSPSHQLILPEGTRVTGKVTLVHPARMFHRGGQLRFAFERVDVPTLASAETPRPEPVQAQLTAAEPGTGSVKIDSEGTAKATESKKRLLGPVIAGLVAARSMDNDAGKQNASSSANANYSGRTLGGFSGFGLLGTAADWGPRYVGTALGFYGLGMSVYSTVVSRGREVTYEKNSAMAIRFGTPARKH